MLHHHPDPLATWQAATRDLLAMLSPRMPASAVRFMLIDGRRIELLIDPALPSPPAGDPGGFDPTPLQCRIIQFLASSPKSAKQLREKIGSHLYDSAGALNDLISLGVVEKKLARYRLTEDVGKAMAEEIGDEEIED